jgi:methyl coenzyme M reductase gamma subunit
MLRVVGSHLLLNLDGRGGIESLLKELLGEDVFERAHGGEDAARDQAVKGLLVRLDENSEMFSSVEWRESAKT